MNRRMSVIGHLSRMFTQLSMRHTKLTMQHTQLCVRQTRLAVRHRASATTIQPTAGNPAFRGSNPAIMGLSMSDGPLTIPCRGMATITQISRKGQKQHKQKRKQGQTEGRPQLRGVVLKTLAKKPKKPNSANRKCVRIKLSTGREATAYVPGEGHNLQEHSIVLVEGGRVQDLPGVKLKCCRGKYDLAHVIKKTV